MIKVISIEVDGAAEKLQPAAWSADRKLKFIVFVEIVNLSRFLRWFMMLKKAKASSGDTKPAAVVRIKPRLTSTKKFLRESPNPSPA